MLRGLTVGVFVSKLKADIKIFSSLGSDALAALEVGDWGL